MKKEIIRNVINYGNYYNYELHELELKFVPTDYCNYDECICGNCYSL